MIYISSAPSRACVLSIVCGLKYCPLLYVASCLIRRVRKGGGGCCDGGFGRTGVDVLLLLSTVLLVVVAAVRWCGGDVEGGVS